MRAAKAARAGAPRHGVDRRAYREKRMEYVLVLALFWLVLNGLAVWLFRDLWRKAALVPAGLMGLALAVAVLGGLAGSNLAPIWVVFALPLCLALTLLLWLVKGIAWAVGR